MSIIEFTQDVPGIAAKGAVVDIADAASRAFIDAGQARVSDIGSLVARSLETTLANKEAELQRKLDELKGLTRSAPARAPGGDPGVAIPDNWNGVTRTPAEASSKFTIGELTRCMYWRSAYGDDPRISESQARYAKQKLDHIWKLQRTQWVDGSEAAVSRDNPHGVTRDGAESTQGAATYGYVVRPEFMTEVFRIEAETDVMTNLREIPMGQSVEMHVPALDQYATTTPTRTSNYFAGVTLYRKTEDAARTTSDAKFSEIIFKATDLTALTKVSRDLLADAFIDINGYLQGLFREAFGWRRDWDFLNGTGAGEPQGIFGSPCEVQVTRNTSSHIKYEDCAKMMATMLPQGLRSAYWIINAQSSSEVQAIIAASPAAFAYQPNTLVSQAQWPTIYGNTAFDGILLGLPFKRSEKVPYLGTPRDLTLFSPKYYGEAVKAGIEVALSEHRYFENDQVGIRWKMRNDGQPMMKAAFTGLDGKTYSPVVTLN